MYQSSGYIDLINHKTSRLTFELSDYSWIVRKLTGPATRSTFLIGFVKRRQIGFFKMASSPKFDERWLKGQNAQNLQREDKTYTLTLITSSPYFFEKFQRQFQESLANFCTCKKTERSGLLFSDLQFAHRTNSLWTFSEFQWIWKVLSTECYHIKFIS